MEGHTSQTELTACSEPLPALQTRRQHASLCLAVGLCMALIRHAPSMALFTRLSQLIRGKEPSHSWILHDKTNPDSQKGAMKRPSQLKGI